MEQDILLKVNKAVCSSCGEDFSVGEMIQAEMVGELKELGGEKEGTIAILQTKLLCQVCIVAIEKEEDEAGE